jgi:hypothetical protein
MDWCSHRPPVSREDFPGTAPNGFFLKKNIQSIVLEQNAEKFKIITEEVERDSGRNSMRPGNNVCTI